MFNPEIYIELISPRQIDIYLYGEVKTRLYLKVEKILLEMLSPSKHQQFIMDFNQVWVSPEMLIFQK